MPFVNVRVAGKLTRDQKKKIAMDITVSLEKHVGKPKSTTYVLFDDPEKENWAVGGELLG